MERKGRREVNREHEELLARIDRHVAEVRGLREVTDPLERAAFFDRKAALFDDIAALGTGDPQFSADTAADARAEAMRLRRRAESRHKRSRP